MVLSHDASKPVTAERDMAGTTPTDWLDEGLAVLASDGPDGLTIDELCRRMDLTKGSFHHHFDGYADFKARLLRHFEAEGTTDIIETVEAEPTPEAKLRRLLAVVEAYSHRAERDPEITIRAWAQHDEAVREVQARVDERRVEYVRSLCRDAGVGEDRVDRLAAMLYAVIVGSEQMQPPIRGGDLRSLFDEWLDHCGLDGPDSPDGGAR